MAKLSEKIGYALGDAAAGGITWKVMSIAFPLFFTNIFGLTVADTATLMLVARLFDVVTDPMMGALADRTQSKWGTYRPWLIFGAIPLGLVFALLLYTPDLGPVGKRIYAYSMYLLMMAVYTAVNVPYGSLLGVMTADDNEKNEFSSYRMVGAYAMGFVTLLSFPYLQKMVGGTPAHQYAVLGVVLGALAALGTLACGLLTKERLKPIRAEKFSFKPFADLFRNKPWIILTLIGICTNFFNGFRYAVAGYLLHGVHDLRRGDLHDLRRAVSGVHQVGGLQAQGLQLGGHHLRRDLHRLLLHPDGPEVHLADDRDGHPHLHRHRLLLAAPVVDVCRCGGLRHREERHVLHGPHLLLRDDGPEVRIGHFRRPGGPPPRYRGLRLGHGCHRTDRRHHHERTGCPADDLDAVLALPGGDRPADRPADAVLSDQEIDNVIHGRQASHLS